MSFSYSILLTKASLNCSLRKKIPPFINLLFKIIIKALLLFFKYELITKAKINLSDKRDEITNDDYFIKIYENGKEYKSYNYVELKDTLNLSNVIKNIELEEGKEYTVELGILIRDRYYALSTFEISTEDEVLGISTLGEWDKIQPYGHYILLNDLDFQNFTNRRIGVGYRYFHGVIDFQGYTMKQATAKTDGSSNTAYYRIYRIESDAVLKNLVLDIQLNNQNLNGSTYGFVHYNYGTIENVVLKITDTKEPQMPQTLLGLLTYQNTLKGRIRNFVVKLENDLHYYGQSAVLVRENYGLIENGYVYGGDVIVDFPLVSGDNRQLGILTRYSGPRAIINHVFMDVTYQFPNNASYDKGGIMAYSNAGTIQNSYVIGDTNIELPDIGPIVQSASGTSRMDNVYYLSDYIYTSKIQDKASFSSLHDVSFQQNVLGDGFNIEENNLNIVSKSEYGMVNENIQISIVDIKKPGEFVEIKLDNYYLRRPISVCRYSDKSVDILYKVLGRGTKDLSTLPVTSCG